MERNFQTKFGEIDIIARQHLRGERSSHLGGVLIFVEVKTKSGEEFGEPWEMVDE
ncbi:YraN family protein, partial [Microgenomates group bacterium]|nr:YraN family protein [Microgenomates group bacterium]